MPLKHKLSIALALYVVLGILAWQTVGDGRLRMAVIVMLGYFGVRALLHYRRHGHADDDGKSANGNR